MFSGIVEATSKIISVDPSQPSLKLELERPPIFDDIELGHSISVNGVCLTIEDFSNQIMKFTLGPETLAITGWAHSLTPGLKLNLERSLRWGDRIHGHLVSGHVDTIARVSEVLDFGDSWVLKIKIDQFNSKLVWKKGSLTVNGVSLTVNNVDNNVVEFCIIPETLRRTNLSLLRSGDPVTIEYDQMAKMYLNMGVASELHT